MKSPHSIVLVGLTLGLIITLSVVAFTTLSPHETILLSVVLAMFSIAASWLATYMYSQTNIEAVRLNLRKEHQESLRTYALNAAEKVQNLSSEMERFADFLSETLGTKGDLTETVLTERIRATLLGINTLKSMNDTALSDWRGVIGEDLQKQAEVESDLEELFNKLEEIEATSSTHEDLLKELPGQFKQLHSEVTQRAKDLAALSPIKVRFQRKKRGIYHVECPVCNSGTDCRIFVRRGYENIQRCGSCQKYFLIKLDDELIPAVTTVNSKEYQFTCSICGKESVVFYPVARAYSLHVDCPHCLARYPSNVKAGQLSIIQSPEISRKFLDILEQLLEKTYPDDSAVSSIATELGIPKVKVRQGAQTLVKLGRIKEIPEEAIQQPDTPADLIPIEEHE